MKADDKGEFSLQLANGLFVFLRWSYFPTKDENKINESSKHRKEMKKNILKATLVAAFGLIAGFNVYNSQKSDVMSDLALANVEALATREDDWSYRLFPCAHKPWNECVLSTDTRRDPCSSSSYC